MLAPSAPETDADGATTLWVLGDRHIAVAHGPADARIGAVASCQRGRVHRRQLLRLGLSPSAIDRRRRSGRLVRVQPSVFVVGHFAEVELGDEAAALLAAGYRAMLAGEGAGAIYGFRPAAPRPIEILMPAGAARPRLPDLTVHRSTILTPRDRRIEHGLPLTSPARTLLDLAAELPDDDLAEATAFALQQRIVMGSQIDELLARAGGHPGRHALRRARDRAAGDAATESKAERAMAELIRRAELPPPTRQHRVLGYRTDFAWPALKLVLEVDGQEFHSTPAAMARDRRRDARLQLAGWTVIRVTAREVFAHPELALSRLALHLGRAIAATTANPAANPIANPTPNPAANPTASPAR